MSMKRRLVLSGALVLSSVSAFSVSADPASAAVPQRVPIARAENPWFAVESVTKLVTHLLEGSKDVDVAALPRAFPPMPLGAAARTRALIDNERAAIFAERLYEGLDSTWTCATAQVMYKARSTSKTVRRRAVGTAEANLASSVEARGFVEQAAELGWSQFANLYRQLC